MFNQLISEREDVMSRRADAWTEYLREMLEEVFSRVRGTEEMERLGSEILESLRSRIKGNPIHGMLWNGVDDIARELGKRKS